MVKLTLNKIAKGYMEKLRICPICKKRISDKMWESQKPIHFHIEHSLGGDFASWGDLIVNCYFCSKECVDKALKKSKSLSDLDYLLH